MIFRVFQENHRNAPSNVRQEARKRNEKLYQQACDLLARSHLPDAETFANSVTDNPILHAIAKDLYTAEGFDAATIPSPPDIPESIEAARYRDQLLTLISKLSGQIAIEDFQKSIEKSFEAFTTALPPTQPGPYTVPLTDLLPNLGKLIEQMIEPLKAPYFATFREQYDKNCCRLSRLPYSKESLASYKLARPSDADEPLLYLQDTVFERIKDARISWGIAEKHHYEGQWILAPQGAGKTTFIEYQISQLLERVQRNECSIIVMDSQEELIPKIAGLQLFAAGQPLQDRLVLIDANDIEFPVALSLFDLGLGEHTNSLEHERMLNTALEMSFFLLEGILGAEMTGPQSGMFRFIMQAMFAIPGATMNTFKELLRPNGLEKYRHYIETLDGAALDFFNNDFTGTENKSLKVTKDSIIRRLNSMMSIGALDRMFNHPRSKISLYDEMNNGKVILINSAHSLLQKKGVEAFGRFFLCLITMAAQRRATLTQKMPCHIFIDELNDYLPEGSDANLNTIIEKCRKQKIALTVAHQNLSRIAVKTIDTLQTVSIKCTSRLTDKDAYLMSRGMRCIPQFLERIPEYHFAVYLRDAPKPVTVYIPPSLDDYPRMTQSEADTIRDTMRARYATHNAPPEADALHAFPTEPTEADKPKDIMPPNASKRPRRDPDA
jgi:hypothetical protein